MKVTWLVLGVGLVFAPAGWAQDAAAVAPKQFKVLAEDDQVRVLEYTDKKGDKVPMHSHPKHMVYVMKITKVKFLFPDGTSKVSEVKAGQAMDGHAILIELKK